MTAPVCIDCAGRLGRGNRTGRCKTCCTRRLTSDPAVNARRAAGVKRFFAENPEARDAHAKRSQERLAAWRASAAGAARLRETSRAAIAHAHTPEAHRRSGASRTANAFAWCPPAYLQEYLHLTRKRNFPAAEARAVIERQVQIDARRAVTANQAAMAARHQRDRAQSY